MVDVFGPFGFVSTKFASNSIISIALRDESAELKLECFNTILAHPLGIEEKQSSLKKSKGWEN